MAGKYIEFVNPGYSTLYTRDLKYTPSTANSYGEASSLNVFDPDSANPLVEGEWLNWAADNKVTRSNLGDGAAAGEGEQISTVPCMLHFAERGRYDSQITKKAHMVTGPHGFELKSKLCLVDSSVTPGTRLFVCGVADSAGLIKRGLMDGASITAKNSGVASFGLAAQSAIADTTSSGAVDGFSYYWSPGYVERYIGTSEIIMKFDPQLVLVEQA